MLKGLKLTLATVAVALISVPLMAMAPTVEELPDPIVSDDLGATQANGPVDNEFVFPDAFDISDRANDPDNGPSPLVWSYAGGGKYTINGVAPLDLGSEDPVAPGAKSIQDQDLDTGNPGQDASAATITVRNVDLSPIGGPNTDPGANNAEGIVASETEVVMVFVSDGEDTAMTEMVIYTQNDGVDQLSPGFAPRTTVSTFVPGTGPADWRFANLFPGIGTVTSAGSADELCMTVTASGINAGEWFSPYGGTANPSASGVDLTDNSVYDFRMNLSTNQGTVGNVPLISFIMDNSDPNDPFGAANAYNQETFFLDNLGGNNSPASRASHSIWFAPSPVSAPQWRSGAFTAGNDPLNDFRIIFRVFDIDGGGWNAEADLGQVCLTGYDWAKWSLGDMSVASTEYDESNIAASNWTIGGLVGRTNVAFSGGNVTVTPSPAGAWNADAADPGAGLELVEFRPGDTNNPVTTGGPDLLDNYPVAQQENVVFLTTIWVSQTAGTPIDLLRHGTDNPTQEVISNTVQTAGMGAVGMPTTGAAQAYLDFTGGNSVTASTLENHNRLRPRADIIIHPALSFNGETTNTAGLVLERVTVDVVTFAQ